MVNLTHLAMPGSSRCVMPLGIQFIVACPKNKKSPCLGYTGRVCGLARRAATLLWAYEHDSSM